MITATEVSWGLLIFYIMAERKSLSKKVRFEVFKRDSFTCQYCGAKAPNVILEVDHINPVKDGGNNEIMNLITSCFACNRGKSSRKIKDDSIVEKQRAQIEELNIRRQQLEMMLEWRDGVSSIKNESYQKAINYWNSKWDKFSLSKKGEKDIERLMDKFGLINLLDAIDIAFSKYGTKEDKESFEKSFSKLGGILFLQNAPEYKQKISYIKGICRNTYSYFNETQASILINKYYQEGYDLEELKELILSGELRNWSTFKSYLQSDGI